MTWLLMPTVTGLSTPVATWLSTPVATWLSTPAATWLSTPAATWLSTPAVTAVSGATLETLVVSRGAYVVYALLVGVGLFVLVDDDNLVKKVVGLNLFQTGVFLFFIASAFRVDGRSPLLSSAGPYVNPLPHVLILTAIVVGVSVTAVALALVVRVYDEYGTFDERDITEARRP